MTESRCTTRWVAVGLGLQTAAVCAGQSWFATRVVVYAPAPGQNVGNPQFNDPIRALGAPLGGGTLSADNSKVVTLGGFGGSITLGFDRPIVDHPPTATNPGGCDLIIYGNAFWAGGNPDVRWGEAGIVEVSVDSNGNGLADDAWLVIPGSHLPHVPTAAWSTVEFDAGPARSGYRLNGAPFVTATPALINPLGNGEQGVWGYADCSPTMGLGDLDGDGEADREGLDPAWFYTQPSDPLSTAIAPFSGGGDGVDIARAVLPDGTPPLGALTRVDFVRITTGVHHVRAVLGEVSTEVGGVAVVRPRARADLGGQGGLAGPDGVLNNNDFVVFIDLFFRQSVLADIGGQGGVGVGDGLHDNNDFVVLIDWFFSGV